jgi:CheY-like chemotaxis protein
MFSQVDRSVERMSGGLGIGLALVKALTEMHEGTVEVESNESGSTFTVKFPVHNSNNQLRTSAAGPRSVQSASYRVLVVDDNRDSANTLSMLLRMLGQEVKTAYDGLEAVQCADTFRPDLILMDVGMPRLNGYEATREIRRFTWGKNIRIVVLSGWGQEADRQLSQEAGCDDHLVKPVSLQDLQSVLNSLSTKAVNAAVAES